MRVFEHDSFGKIRAGIIDDAVWFVAADVCRALEIKNRRAALKRLDEDEKGVASIDTPGGQQDMRIVSEPGLYALALGSRRMPEAKAFKDWIAHDVIPAILKQGFGTLNTSIGEQMLEQAKMLVRRIAALEEGQRIMQERIDDLERKNETRPEEYYTIAGYATLQGYRVDLPLAAKLDEEAMRSSRRLGYPVFKTTDPQFGIVNTYHVDVLKGVVQL